MQQQPLSIVMNIQSGYHAQGHEQEIRLIAQTLTQAGFAVDTFLTTVNCSLNQCIAKAVTRHQQFNKNQQGIIVAAGGDGTVNAVAQKLMNTSIELGILPFGTFNYVARVLNIPIELTGAVQNLITGQAKSIHLGSVNGQIYLNNASIGLYPMIIEQREDSNKRFGRLPFVAYLSGLSVLMQSHRHYKLQMKIDGKLQPIDSPMVFFGNNQLQLKELKLKLANCVTQGKLAGVAIGKVNRWQLLQLVVKMLQGELEQANDVYSFCADEVEILTRKSSMKVALDGEIVRIATPLKFTVMHDAIKVRVPDATTFI